MITIFPQQTRFSMRPYSDIVRIAQRGSQKERVMGERWWWGRSRDHNSCWWFTVGSKLVMAMWTTSTVTRYRVYVSITGLICISLRVFHKHIFLKRFIVKVIVNDYRTAGYLCFTRGCAAKRSKNFYYRFFQWILKKPLYFVWSEQPNPWKELLFLAAKVRI